jgi:hypothetical protein
MTHGKRTNSGWPEPNDWVNDLYETLKEQKALYDAVDDPHQKREEAARVLSTVVGALLSLPAFKNDTVHLPLKDILILLNDLRLGRSPVWAQPVNYGGTNATNTTNRELKLWVRAAYGVLATHGFGKTQAYKFIADGLKKSGRSSKQGNLRWRTIADWCREPETPSDQLIKRRVDQWWIDFQRDHSHITVVDSTGKPVPERRIAEEFINDIWALEHLRDRSFS